MLFSDKHTIFPSEKCTLEARGNGLLEARGNGLSEARGNGSMIHKVHFAFNKFQDVDC